LKHILFFTLIIAPIFGWSQPKLKRNSNSTLKLYFTAHPQWNSNQKLAKWQKQDTLKIPFFDDFVSTKVYPDSTKWYNNYVYVNNDFAIKPPSYGVATFDDLDSKGNPYQELNDQTFGACDTLLSLAINLKDSSTKAYTLADSIYFSFYYQRQGLGDPSDSRDSIIVQFKDKDGNWKTMWKAKGGSVEPFKFVIIGVKDTKYLFKGFQFRFINFSRHTGNLNQWHVDYVHLARNRKAGLKYYDDIAIQSRPTSLLKNFYQMPYDHFQADSSNQKAKLIFVNASNLHNVIKNVQARHIESSKGTTIVSTDYNANNANVPAQDTAKRRFQGFNLNNLSGSPVVIKRDYEIRESGIASKYPANDKITVYQEFGSCYAYDDGTAEYGFGYDDDVIDPFYKGAIAYKFNLTKADSVWAIGMFFNRSVKSTSALRFDLKVWQKISPLGQGRNADVSLKTMTNLSPVFTDTINGYHVYYLDTALFMPKGDFYIGWEQVGNNHLDVGYDINNGHHDTESSDNLFWADRGNWTAVNFKGALMMRPYVGKKIGLGEAKVAVIKDKSIKCFPNPFTNKITVDNSKGISSIKVYDLSGKQVGESFSNEIDMQLAQPGIYSLEVTTKNGEIFHQKMVKLHY
jgi:hypothetical protein